MDRVSEWKRKCCQVLDGCPLQMYLSQMSTLLYLTKFLPCEMCLQIICVLKAKHRLINSRSIDDNSARCGDNLSVSNSVFE